MQDSVLQDLQRSAKIDSATWRMGIALGVAMVACKLPFVLTTIGEQDQERACALTHRYGSLGHDAQPALDLMLRYGTQEDGALHAEKYYITASSDFADTRPALRWRHLTSLARVTASEYGQPAPGYAQACELLRVKA